MRDRTLRTIGASVILVGLVVAGVTQVGASADTTPDEITAPEATTTAGEETTSTGAPTTAPEPFTYRIGVLSGVSTDNFWAFYGEQPSAWNSYILGPTKPALFTSKTSGSALQTELAAGRPEPENHDGAWSVTLDLVEDLYWSDGTPVTAHDLVFTFETVRSLELGGSWARAFPGTVERIVADGDHRIRIEFAERPQLSVWPHAVGLAPIMARHAWEPIVEGATATELYEAPGEVDVSGGPLVVETISEERIISQANPGYPDGDVPNTIEYHVYADEIEAVSALAAGDIDSILSPKGLAGTDVEPIESNPGVEVLASPGNSIRYIGFNLKRAPMSGQEFRTALALLVDRDGLAESIPQTDSAARSLVPAANERWFDAEAAAENASMYEGKLEERLAEALDGLRAAGYEWDTEPAVEEGTLVPGSGLTIDGRDPQPLTILTPGDEYDPARPEYVAEIAGTLGVLGFDARPVETDFDTVVDLAFTPGEDGTPQYDMYMLGWTLGNPALPGYYRALFAGDGPMNNTGYDSEEFGAALERYEGSYTMEEARKALWDMERTLAEDLPYLLLYSAEIVEAYRSDRVAYGAGESLGGLQARLGGIWDVAPAD